jgi:hypothetical protein
LLISSIVSFFGEMMALSLRYIGSEYDSAKFGYVDLIISSIAESDFAISISCGMSICSESPSSV